MKIVQFIVDNSAAITGVVTSGIGLAVLFGLDISKDQIAGIVTFLGAVVLVLSAVITTAKRRVLTLVADNGQAVAGPAAKETTGTPVATAQDHAGDTVAFATVAA